MSNCCCTQPKEIKKLPCPTCQNSGQSVPMTVVKFILEKEPKKIFDESLDWYACTAPKCTTAYFDAQNTILYSTTDLKKPIWYKEGAQPQIACYCNKINFEDVHAAVTEKGLVNWKEIVLNFRKIATCKCDHLNPLGICCTEVFYGEVNKALIKVGKEPITNPEGCC